MNVVFHVCVLLAALTSSCWSRSSQSAVFVQPIRAQGEAVPSDSPPSASTNHRRQVRSAGAPPAGQLANYDQEDADAQRSLRQLLARLIARKRSAFQTRSSLGSRVGGLATDHRIKDRDYLGWMDFGRRSVEDELYTS